jgi:hypothetical protein
MWMVSMEQLTQDIHTQPVLMMILRKFLTLQILAALVVASASAQTTNTIADGGNAQGFDMAPEKRLEVVQAAVAAIPTKLPPGPFEPTWE